jgi:hypothetical protein
MTANRLRGSRGRTSPPRRRRDSSWTTSPVDQGVPCSHRGSASPENDSEMQHVRASNGCSPSTRAAQNGPRLSLLSSAPQTQRVHNHCAFKVPLLPLTRLMEGHFIVVLHRGHILGIFSGRRDLRFERADFAEYFVYRGFVPRRGAYE